MTDYSEEQINEIEALESIYPEEVNVLSTEPFHSFQVSLTDSQDDPEHAVSCVIQFTYTPKYPDELPVIEIADSDNLDDFQLNELSSLMKEQGEENLGMVMVFIMVSAVQERLDHMVQASKKEIEDAKERKQREFDEAERKRLEGTRVTIESFIAWKSSFDEEMLELKGTKKKEIVTKKLTGKELFLQDHTMDDSDVKFLEEDGDSVEVDESLFEDLDDLDIDDES